MKHVTNEHGDCVSWCSVCAIESAQRAAAQAAEQKARARQLYPEQNHMELGEYYTRHVAGMTAAGLDGKADIAAQLAWRDIEIDRLRQSNAFFSRHAGNLNRELAEARRIMDRLRERLPKCVEGDPSSGGVVRLCRLEAGHPGSHSFTR